MSMDTRAALMSEQQALVVEQFRAVQFTFGVHDNQFKLAEIKYWNEIWNENWDGETFVNQQIWLANAHSNVLYLSARGKMAAI